jgi:hypothetical protein
MTGLLGILYGSGSWRSFYRKLQSGYTFVWFLPFILPHYLEMEFPEITM